MTTFRGLGADPGPWPSVYERLPGDTRVWAHNREQARLLQRAIEAADDHDIRNAPDEPDESCAHEHVSDEPGYPNNDGRCRVYGICEDCGENLGQTGWDSI